MLHPAFMMKKGETNRDMSYEAMTLRYKKANGTALMTQNRIAYDSLQDTQFLIEQNRMFMTQVGNYGRLSLENEFLKEEVQSLTQGIEILEKELADARAQIKSIVCAYSD